jgi:hypothetical protein
MAGGGEPLTELADLRVHVDEPPELGGLDVVERVGHGVAPHGGRDGGRETLLAPYRHPPAVDADGRP